MELITLNISKYDNAFSKSPTKVNLRAELQRIKSGQYKELIENCRLALQLGDKAGYDVIKSRLPAITFGGVFDGAHKRDNLRSYSKKLIIDLDQLADAGHTKRILFEDPYIFACWLSPSGNGIKLLINTDATPETHKFYFDFVAKYLQEKYGVNVDRSGSDICRLCYVSHDSELLFKEESAVLALEVVSNNEQEMPFEKSANREVQIGKMIESEKALFLKTEGRNRPQDRLQIQKIVRYLQSKKLSITNTYELWVKVAFAIANTFTHDVGRTYFLEMCRLDGIKHSESKSESLLEYAYRNRIINAVTFASIIYLATERGYDMSFNKPTIKTQTPR